MISDYTLFIPELILLGLIFAVWTLDLIAPRAQAWVSGLAVVGLAAVVVSAALLWGRPGTLGVALAGGLLRIDGYALFFAMAFPVAAGVMIVGSYEFARRFLQHRGEFVGFVLTAALMALLMSAANELLTAYIALETLSFSLYVLVAYARRNLRSQEAALKYVLLGAFSSGLLLYGISLVYGATATTQFDEIARLVSVGVNPALIVGLILILAGLGFKVAAVPFHIWTPDVYEGAPIPVTAYLSAVSKTAAFALTLRLLSAAFGPLVQDWQVVTAVMAVLTMTVGNLVALRQSNLKRLLAYSSISQAGYVLVGLTAATPAAATGVVLHLVVYALTNLAGFFAAVAFVNRTGKERIADLAGLGRRAPFLALVLTIALFSLAGMPLFAGFVSKFYLFTAAAAAGWLWLAGVAIVNSLISLYYYLLVVKRLYVAQAGERGPIPLGWELRGLLWLLLLAIFALGLYPAPLANLIQQATAGFFR